MGPQLPGLNPLPSKNTTKPKAAVIELGNKIDKKHYYGLHHKDLVQLTTEAEAHHHNILQKIDFEFLDASQTSLKSIVKKVGDRKNGYDFVNTSFNDPIQLKSGQKTLTPRQRADALASLPSEDIDLANAFGPRWCLSIGNDARRITPKALLNNTAVGDPDDQGESFNTRFSNAGLKDTSAPSILTLFPEQRDGGRFWTVDSNQNDTLDLKDYRSKMPAQADAKMFSVEGTSFSSPRYMVQMMATAIEQGTAQHTIAEGFHFETPEERYKRGGPHWQFSRWLDSDYERKEFAQGNASLLQPTESTAIYATQAAIGGCVLASASRIALPSLKKMPLKLTGKFVGITSLACSIGGYVLEKGIQWFKQQG